MSDDEVMQEFFLHPGWRRVVETLEKMQASCERDAARELDNHPFKAGKLEGILLVMQRLTTLKQAYRIQEV